MKNVAVRNIDRSDVAVLDELASFGVASAHEAIGKKGLLAPTVRPIYSDASIAGNAVTVLAQPGDNWMLHVAMELCQPGDILVVTCTQPCTDGFFGDLLATSAQARGVRGLVIEGGVRDIASLKAMAFPVWSTAIYAQGTVKEKLGSVNIPIQCAGQQISPGDAVVADSDGVCVIPHGQVASTLESVRERAVLEKDTRGRLAAGALGLDIYNMRPRLEKEGLVYLDSLEDYKRLAQD